jgi:glutaredoxin
MIEFQYFSGCPHAKDTIQNLREVMTEMGIVDGEMHIINITSPELAQKLKFQGSPTILINGIDIYSGMEPKGFSYSYRV